ncbi:MAG: hypothetical protein V7751_19925 [Pseudoalteromonas distincta]|jgi:protein-arginine kinase activator protein McsA|uniref:hypothetical protein n=1 Tax=Halopseudomonas aestusnigri TaxID=857252 RepID=UPI001D17DB00|nr:hypothetical protein [Halopseudomonas aestusnigri]MCC4261464.1 hypothetical protein [Halopseudomonas aestusnigri]|tara:strand:+ start:495 stop:791 length:297 start_codon:yes stop_codon:yes gene_type:complete
MKVMDQSKAGADAVTVCDVCNSPTQTEHGEVQCGFLQAHWGYGSIHDGDRYEVRLCEGCFFMTLAYLKQEHRIQRLFDEVSSQDSDSFGLVMPNDVER